MDNLIESRPATMKFSDAHNILTDIGYNFARQSGSSHKVYSKPNSKNIVLSPHGKDISPASTREVHNAVKVHKLRKLSEAIVEGNLILAKEIFEEIIKDKIAVRLTEKKQEVATFCLEGNPETKKIAKRLYRKVGKMSREMGDNPRSITAAGRKLFSVTPPEKLRAILAVEGWTKIENKKTKKEIEKRIKDNLKKSHIGDISGRMQMKLLPSDIIKKYSKKAEEKPWNRTFKLQTESNGKFKYHLNITQPHIAFEKNIKRRENLEKKLDVLSKKGINK